MPTTKRSQWSLVEWNQEFSSKVGAKLPPLSQEEVKEGIRYLRDNMYPKPTDCPGIDCPDWRPACSLGTCKIAVGMCGDF